MIVRLRVTGCLDDCTIGACLEERENFSKSFDFEDPSRFCSRASRMRARMSSNGEAAGVSPSSVFDWVALDLRLAVGPKEACALARAPKEMLLNDACTSSWPSSLFSSSSSSSSSFSWLMASDSSWD